MAPRKSKDEGGQTAPVVTEAAAEGPVTSQSALGDGGAEAEGKGQPEPADDATTLSESQPESQLEPHVDSQAKGPTLGPKDYSVKVIGPAKGRWRAGRKFGPEPVLIPAPELTEEEFEQLAGDPELMVEVLQDEAAA